MEELLVCPDEALPLSLRFQILDLLRLEWPGASLSSDELNDPALHPAAVALTGQGRLLSYCGVIWKYLALSGYSFKTYAISGMVTDPAGRGLGYGQKVLAAARALMDAGGADLALFTCAPSLRAFYESGGFEVLPDTPLIGGTRAAPFPSDSLDLLTMAAFFSPLARTCRDKITGGPIFLDLAPGDLW